MNETTHPDSLSDVPWPTRRSVRDHPLASVAAALAVGAVISRLNRATRH